MRQPKKNASAQSLLSLKQHTRQE